MGAVGTSTVVLVALVQTRAVLLVLQTTTGEVRARLGETAHQRSDFVIVTNSSPRLEDPADIVRVRK